MLRGAYGRLKNESSHCRAQRRYAAELMSFESVAALVNVTINFFASPRARVNMAPDVYGMIWKIENSRSKR